MKKLIKYCLLLVALTLCITANAQKQDYPTVGNINSVYDFKTIDAKASEFKGYMSLGGNETLLLWKERTTSLSSDSDIRTYVLYVGDMLAGSLSINGTQAVGEVSVNGNSYKIASDAMGNFTVANIDACNSCTSCGGTIGPMEQQPLRVAQAQNGGSRVSAVAEGSNSIIKNSDVLRRYRLALLIDYWAYPNNKRGAEAFMASLEAYLNEIYYRDFGICFELVKDDNLIRDTEDKAVYYETSSGINILTYSKSKFDELISPDDYDIGFVIHPMRYETGVGVGYAYMDYAYLMRGRTQGVAINSTRTVAHELGHMFGAGHTFIESDSYQTELGNGQSLMGTEKASPRNFISLVTLRDMRQRMAEKNLYYVDAERTRVVALDGTEKDAAELTDEEKAINIVNGVKTHNNAPVIDDTKLKPTYVVPPGAFLQFRIPATDADGDELTYTAQQADVYKDGAAHFRTNQGTKDPCVMIRRDYYNGELLEYSENTTEAGKTYTFWLAASDPKPYSVGAFENDPHATAYDVYETKIQVKGSAKFVVSQSPNIVSSCYEGYKVKLNWTADPEVFDESSRFRVLFSKDGGATYDCVLKDNIRALDNTCDIYIPYGIGTEYYADRNGKKVYKCLLKLEHVDGVAFMEFPKTSTSVGFYISGTRVVFDGLPTENYIETTRDKLPPVPTVTASKNGGAAVNFTETETEDGKYIFRTWETTYNNRTYGFEQIIKIIDDEVEAPADGTYLRIRAAKSWLTTQPYLSSESSPLDASRAAFVKSDDESTLFYYTDGKLLAVKSANYIGNNDNYAGYTSTNVATEITFQPAANGESGVFNIAFKGNDGTNRYLYTDTNLYTDAGTDANAPGYNFEIETLSDEEVEALPSFELDITVAGYATMYLDYAVAIPEGVKAYAVTSVESTYVRLTEYADVIPANTGVIVKSDGTTHLFKTPEMGWTAIESSNLLNGTVADECVAGDAYVLAKPEGKEVGFYKAELSKNAVGESGSTHFMNRAYKAYLPAPAVAANAAFYSFNFGNGTTFVEEIAVEDVESGSIYDLSGRKLKVITAPGIYIVNGKKVVIK